MSDHDVDARGCQQPHDHGQDASRAESLSAGAADGSAPVLPFTPRTRRADPVAGVRFNEMIGHLDDLIMYARSEEFMAFGDALLAVRGRILTDVELYRQRGVSLPRTYYPLILVAGADVDEPAGV